MMSVRLVIFAGVLIAFGGIALVLDQQYGPPTSNPDPESGVSSAAFMAASFPDLAGRQQALGQWQGKLLVINFWATWCAPCREEMPSLNRLHQKYAAKGLQIVGIAADSADKVTQFSKEIGITYPLLADSGAAIEFSKRLGNRLGLLPHTVVVGSDGKQIFSKLGVIQEMEFEVLISQNLPK